jgi:hypothetical protein
MTTTDATPDASVVTNERANMLAAHAVFVQGGFSTPEIERARAEADIKRGLVIDWDAMRDEVIAATAAAGMVVTPSTPPAEPATAAPAPEAAPVAPVDVTAVLAHVDQGEALRDRIKKMTAELKGHEDAIKAALGLATEGVDAKGKVVVRFPHRSRHGLDKKAVQAILSPEDWAAVSRVTNYRTLLYGESDS